MIRTTKYLLLLCMALLCFSCTENDVIGAGGAEPGGTTGGRVQLTLNISTPEAFSTLSTRSISEENESVLNGNFVVFAFDGEGEGSKLLFTVKTGDTNTGTNLNGVDSDTAYGNYTTSPSIAWHPDTDDNGNASSGRLYIEANETQGPVYLLVLANVWDMKIKEDEDGNDEDDTDDESKVTKMLADLSATATKETVLSALSALDYDVTSVDYIPMAGECTLTDGITLGSQAKGEGSVFLRRSVAKFTVRVEYTAERYPNSNDYPFLPSTVEILNVNKYATVYAPSADNDMPNIPTNNEKGNPTVNFPNDWKKGTNSDDEEVYYKEVVFYVAETLNSREAAYNDNVASDDPRVSVLVSGTYTNSSTDEDTGSSTDEDTGSSTGANCWYRLDLIPETGEDEITNILRNHHYIFTIRDVTYKGSESSVAALQMSVPDNFKFDSEGNATSVVVVDEDILSITVEYNSDGDGNSGPYYVGVSSTSIELNDEEGACAHVKVVTNFADWSIDESYIPTSTDGKYAISFVWDNNIGEDGSYSLWLWLDYPNDVQVGETYYYYIVAGNIRKRMDVTIKDSSEEETDNDGET